MGIDALLKRFFPVVVLVLIGVAAYFQASGIGRLVASSVAVDPASLPTAVVRSRQPGAPLPASTDHSTSGLAILTRNPFDSVTDLLGEKVPVAAEVVEEEAAPAVCDGARVVLITWSEDPEWSFASIAGSDGKSMLRRKGDDLNGYEVDEIEWDRVWMKSSTGARCHVIVGGGMSGGKAASAAPRPTETKRVPVGAKSRVPEAISSKIHRIDDTHFEVERSVIGLIMENQAQLVGSVGVMAGKDGDKGAGLQLKGIRPGSLLESLGMQNGDRFQSINGIDMTDPTQALQAYPTLLKANRLSVSIQRGGKPMSIEVNIK